jgi:cysteine desulfurase
MTPIYLDYNATTPIDPAVLKAMLPYLQDEFGNPSSAHALGVRARDAVETARAEVAALIGAASDEIVFTSGGTEASNMAIRGAAKIHDCRRDIVTTTIEHPATETCCTFLQDEKYKVTRVAAERDGLIDPARIEAAIDGKTALVTIIHVQNEIGTIQPVAEIAAATRRCGALTHADAAQSVGKIPSTSKILESIFSRSPDTNFMRRKASARSMSAAESSCRHFFLAPARNAAVGLVPKMSPTSLRLAKHAGSPA